MTEHERVRLHRWRRPGRHAVPEHLDLSHESTENADSIRETTELSFKLPGSEFGSTGPTTPVTLYLMVIGAVALAAMVATASAVTLRATGAVAAVSVTGPTLLAALGGAWAVRRTLRRRNK